MYSVVGSEREVNALGIQAKPCRIEGKSSIHLRTVDGVASSIS